jgi:hypothetical protein
VTSAKYSVDGSQILEQGSVCRHQDRQRGVVAESLRVALPCGEQSGRLVLGSPDAEGEREEGTEGLHAQRDRVTRVLTVRDEGDDPPPVGVGLGVVVQPDPSRSARMPARRREIFTCPLLVMRERRRLLVEPAGRQLFDDARHGGVGLSTTLLQLRAISHLLGQWVPEGTLNADRHWRQRVRGLPECLTFQPLLRDLGPPLLYAAPFHLALFAFRHEVREALEHSLCLSECLELEELPSPATAPDHQRVPSWRP